MVWTGKFGFSLGARFPGYRLAMLCLLLSGFSLELHAQNWNEWVRQKKTQQRYLAQQILALKMYAGYAKKGYDLVAGGLGTIRNLGQGEFRLHGDFLGSLKKVGPLVRSHGRLAEALSLQRGIMAALQNIDQHGALTVSDRAFIDQVKDSVVAECLAELQELLLLVTDGGLELSQAARLERLEAIYRAMVEKSGFVGDFVEQMKLLIVQRQSELGDMDSKWRLYGIPD